MPNNDINPFYRRKTLTDINQFYGRKEEIKKVFSLIRVAESCSLIGERRIGKSSFLQYIIHPQTRASYGLPLERYIVGYFDFLGYTNLTPSDFWNLILEELSYEINDEKLSLKIEEMRKSEIKLQDLSRLMKELHQKGFQTTILLDEFEYAASNPNFDLSFFGGLRNLSTNCGLAYVIASTNDLLELYYVKNVIGSPFFNIFTNVFLGPFPEDEALELIKSPLEESCVSFSEKDVDFIFKIAGLHPFFLQLACYHLFDAYKSKQLKEEEARFRHTLANFKNDALRHFKYYWDNSNDEEKIIFAALSILEQRDSRGFRRGELEGVLDEKQLKSLENRGLIKNAVSPQTGAKPEVMVFSSAFGEWIVEEITSQRGTVSFEEWVDKVKPKGRINEAASAVRNTLSKVNPRYWEMLTRWVSQPGNLDKGKKLLETMFTGILNAGIICDFVFSQ
ncbi:MAG: hypothetical protein QME81_16885 [bacterium]|nr:hypothetical protein [bacterium]